MPAPLTSLEKSWVQAHAVSIWNAMQALQAVMDIREKGTAVSGQVWKEAMVKARTVLRKHQQAFKLGICDGCERSVPMCDLKSSQVGFRIMLCLCGRCRGKSKISS